MEVSAHSSPGLALATPSSAVYEKEEPKEEEDKEEEDKEEEVKKEVLPVPLQQMFILCVKECTVLSRGRQKIKESFLFSLHFVKFSFSKQIGETKVNTGIAVENQEIDPTLVQL